MPAQVWCLIWCIILLVTGSQFGMTLVLNAEQYEYSKGPFTDIGVKASEPLSKWCQSLVTLFYDGLC